MNFKAIKLMGFVIVMIYFSYGVSLAHFGMVIPSDNMIMQDDKKEIALDLSFSHPFEIIGMPLVKPQAFTVVKDGKKNDLLSTLQESKAMGFMAWKSEYQIKRPGSYTFCMEPRRMGLICSYASTCHSFCWSRGMVTASVFCTC